MGGGGGVASGADLQGLYLWQGDGLFVSPKPLKEVIFISILLIVQQVHQPKQLPHVVLHWCACKYIRVNTLSSMQQHVSQDCHDPHVTHLLRA